MDTKEILKKAALLKRNPELANVIPNSEIISLVNDVLGAFSKLQTVIEQNKLKGDKGDDGVTPVAGKDYPSFDQIDEVLSSALRDYGEKYGKLQTELQAQIERASELENGKDAEITEELIAQVAELAVSLIDLPDFETLVSTEINRNGEAIRNALELLQGDERLDASAIKGLDAYIKTTYVNGGTIGKGQVYGFIRQAVADGTIPTGGGSGTVESVVAGTGISVDNTDPANPIISATGGGGGAVDSVNGQTGVVVLDADDIDDTSTTNKFATAAELADIAANTAARHDAVTLAGTPNYISIVGQVITRTLIDLASHVTGRLPFANLTQLSAHQVLGRAGTGTGDVAGITMGNDTILGRSGSGDIDDLSATQVRTVLNVADGATAYTDELAQDAIGTILTDTTSIDLIYDDAGNTISAQREALTGDVTASKNSNATTIANDAVSNAKMANMAVNTIKGRITAGTGDPEDLTAAQVRTITETETTTQLNTRDTNNRARANHTGTQLASTISDFNETAQDAVGTILTDTTSIDAIYDDAGNTISFQREALSGDVTAPKNSNTTTLATVNSNVGSFGLAGSVAQFTVNAKGLITAAANVAISITASAVTDFAATVRATVLTGLSTATSTAVSATDSILVAIGKLQAQNTVQDTAIALNTAKVTNATHTGDMAGATALTAQPALITGKSAATVAGGDLVLIADVNDSNNLKQVTAQSIADLGGGGGNTFNDIYIDQAGGTSDTYGVLAGTRNGSNTLFTVSEAVYATGTLKVWRNGQLMTQGSSEDFVETTPASGTFTLAVAPAATDEITVEYQKVVTNSDTILTTTNYGNAVVRVVHGATAGTARPSGVTYVEWVGSVEPTNATNNDTWVETA